MHECTLCGFYCDCDGEDMEQPQPDDCTHDCEDPDYDEEKEHP